MPTAPPRAASTQPLEVGPALMITALVGFATWVKWGEYADPALLLCIVAAFVALWRFAESLRGRPAIDVHVGAVAPLLYIGVVVMGATAFADEALVWYTKQPWNAGRTALGVAVIVLLSYAPALFAGVAEPRWWRDARFAIIAALIAFAGREVIRTSPSPAIDVWSVQTQAAELLRHGHNPYTGVVTHDSNPFAGPGAAAVPYVYPPTSIYLGLVGFVLGGDVRFTMVGMIVIAGLALRAIVRASGRTLPAFAEDAAPLFLWFWPKLFFLVEQAWIDPMQVGLLALAVLAHVKKKPMLTAVIFGVLLASKQSMIWMAPLACIALRLSLRQWIVMGGTAFALELPFLVWDWKALKYANFDFLSSLPARDEALTFNSWYKRRFHAPLSDRWGFGVAIASVALASWRAKGSPARFMQGVAFTYFAFFFLNKWAFCNYYFTIGSFYAIGAAASFHTDGARAAPALQS